MNREEFFRLVEDRPAAQLRRIQTAYWLSKEGHRNQTRTIDGNRYFTHPRRVAASLVSFGHDRTDTLVLALIHDLLEDSNIPEDLIVNTFGPDIWRELCTLSKVLPSYDPLTGWRHGGHKKDTKEYYASIAEANRPTRLVKLADRLDNLLDGEEMAVRSPERLRKQLTETEEFILPFSAETDLVMHAKLVTRVAELRCLL